MIIVVLARLERRRFLAHQTGERAESAVRTFYARSGFEMYAGNAFGRSSGRKLIEIFS